MSQWRYIAQRLPSGEFLDWDVPLSDVTVTSELSGPGGLVGTVPVETLRLLGADGRPILEPWGCAIWAEAAGQIRGGGILVDSSFDGQAWRLDCVGLSGYAAGTPWTGDEYAGVSVDPLSVVRRIWSHMQSQDGGNLGVVVDSTTSPVRVGTEKKEIVTKTRATKDKPATETTTYEDIPFTLTPWETTDLGKVIDDLAAEAPFDYVNHTAWDGEQLTHRLELVYPRRGARRDDLRFVVGENVIIDPKQVVDGGDYASEVVVFGAGEGRKMVRTHVTKDRGRLRRVVVVADKSATTKQKATATARTELALLTGEVGVTDITVTDSAFAEIASLVVGDEIFIQSEAGWVDLALWVRILAITLSPDRLGVASLRVARSEVAV